MKVRESQDCATEVATVQDCRIESGAREGAPSDTPDPAACRAALAARTFEAFCGWYGEHFPVAPEAQTNLQQRFFPNDVS
jgi:hypothetical protein